jgi:hypothetical protein
VGKYIAGILGALALIWTAYVAVNIASSGPSIAPSSVFAEGESVFVAHFPYDFRPDESSSKALSEPFFQQLFENPGRVQHMYFSLSGDKALMQRSKPWTIEVVKRYFGKMNLGTEFLSSRKLKLSNGWTAGFDKEFLLISQNEPLLQESSAPDWKYMDGKCAFTLVSWTKGLASIENVYQEKDGDLLYVSSSNTSGSSLADDQDAFLDVIPDSFDEYTFHEKEYLRSIDNVPSPAYTWADRGFVTLRNKGLTCIITDFIPGQDPIAVLGDAIAEESINDRKTSGHVTNTRLPGTLLRASSWYVEVFNNRVFIAEEKAAIDNVIGAYEAGRTVPQNAARYIALFGNVPKKVSYRHISAGEHRSVSLLEGSRHMVVRQLGGTEETEKGPKGPDPIRIEGGIAQILPIQGSNFVYVVSKDGTISGIGKNGIQWQTKTEGGLLMDASFTGSGEELMAITPDKVHVFNRSGELPGFPRGNGGNPIVTACYFSWKGQEQLAIADRSSLSVYNSSGSRVSAFKLPYSPARAPMLVWVKGRELMASFIGEDRGFTVSVDKRRKSSELGLSKGDTKLMKTAAGPVYFNLSGGLLQKITWNGAVSPVSGNASAILGHEADKNYLLVLSGGNVAIFDENGGLVKTVKPGFSDVESASAAQGSSGRLITGVLDGLANYGRVFGAGAATENESYEGSKLISVHRLQNGSIQLISQSNSYLVRYPVN